MSTLAEIEAAAETLPLLERRELVQRLQAKLPKPSLHDLMKDGCGMIDSGVTDLGSREDDATRLAKEVDAGWWGRNRERILKEIEPEADL